MQIWYFCSLFLFCFALEVFFFSEVTISFDDFIYSWLLDANSSFALTLIVTILLWLLWDFFLSFFFFLGFFWVILVFFWQINKTSHTILLLLHKALLELSDFWRRDRIITSVLTTNAAWNQSIIRDMNWPWSPLCISTENIPVTPARLLLRLHFCRNSVVEDSSKL